MATHEVRPARRPEKLILWADHEGMELKADGSDLVTVIAAVADKAGNIKHLNNYQVQFAVEGEGRQPCSRKVGYSSCADTVNHQAWQDSCRSQCKVEGIADAYQCRTRT